MPRFAKYEEGDEPVEGYRLVDFLGAGQFGEVWKAQEIATKKLVAIKLIDLSHSSSALKELKALNLVINLNHPNLVPIFTARLKDKNGKEMPLNKAEEIKQKGQLRELVIAMGLGERSLSARLKQLNPDGTSPDDFQGIPLEELLGYMQGAAKGIDYLNKADHGLAIGDGPIIHCDIKPDNMMIVSGEVQIADCGVAVIITPDARQTKAAGSPAYSAPELTGNKPVPGTDQYALAISYYELRTGKLPFDEQMGQLSIMLAHAEGRLDFSSPVISEDEHKVLRWATAVQPRNRYPSCTEMVRQLVRATEGLPPLEPGKVVAKAASVAVATPRPRAVDPGEVRATPQLPVQDPTPPKGSAGLDPFKSTDDVTFELPQPAEELRGTVIPDSGRFLPPSDPNIAFPATATPSGTSGQETRKSNYESFSEILIPTTPEENFGAEETITPPPAPPPPVAASAESLGSLGTINISRPQINLEQDDPMGQKLGAVGLDPEIAKIIKEGRASTPVKQPAARTPPVPSGNRPPSNPVIVPPTTPGRKSTQYPRETPEEEQSLPPWQKEEERSLPPWAKEAERERQKALSQSSLPEMPAASWKPPAPAPAGGGVMKYVAGGVIGVGLAAGGVFFALSGPSSSSNTVVTVPPSPPPPPNVTPEAVDPAKVQAVNAFIANKDFDAAEKAAKELTAGVYQKLQDEWRDQIAKGRQTIVPVKTLDEKIRDIDDLIKKGDAKSLTEAEALARALPDEAKARREAFLKTVADARQMAADDGLTANLKALEDRPAGEIRPAAQLVINRYTLPAQQKAIGKRLIAIGEKKKEHRGPITEVLTDEDRFSIFVPDATDRRLVFAWRADDLQARAAAVVGNFDALAAADDATRGVKVTDARKAVADLSKAIADAGKPFGTAWDAAAVPAAVGKLKAVGEAWAAALSKSPDAVKALGAFLTGDAPPPAAVPMAREYFRLAADRDDAVANVRKVRDASKKWPGVSAADRKVIDGLYQAALAGYAVKQLASNEPNLAALKADLGDEPAFGWTKAVAAEAALGEKKPADALALLKEADDPKVTDDTAADRKAYIGYLRGLAAGNATAADALAAAFENPASFLATPRRKQAAAEVLAAVALSGLDKKPAKPEAPFAKGWNPYPKSENAYRWLGKAYDLAGAANPNWGLHLALLADTAAGKDVVRKWLTEVPVDEQKIAEDDLPVALAYFRLKGEDARLSDDLRVAAYAAGTRLAFRYLDSTLGDCPTQNDVADRDDLILPKIQNQFWGPGLQLAGGRAADRAALRLGPIRAKVLATTPNEDLLKQHGQELGTAIDALPEDHPDRGTALGLKAHLASGQFLSGAAFLRDAGGQAKEDAWKAMLDDARASVRADPANLYGNRVLAYAGMSEYKNAFTQVPFVAPDGRLKASPFLAGDPNVPKMAEAFRAGCDALGKRKNFGFWFVRGVFHFIAANDFARAGDPDTTKKYLAVAKASVENAMAQRPKKRFDDPKTLACVLEDIAWLTGEDAAENYRKAYALLGDASPPTSDRVKFDGLVDRARCTIRAARYGHPQAPERMAEALRTLTAVEEDASPDARTHVPSSKYWRAMAYRTAGKYGEADAAFAEAATAAAATAPQWLPLIYVMRAENALDGADKAAAAKTVRDQVALLRELARTSAVYELQFGYVPDYLLGRLDLLDNDTRSASEHFSAVYTLLTRNADAPTFRTEVSAGLKAVAFELTECKDRLTARDVADRKALLAKLVQRFGWVLTPAEAALVNRAK
jgi:serine/threonine protein kinase